MPGSSSAARPCAAPAEDVLTHVQDTGGHAHRRQEEAFSHTDPNMGQTSKLPDCLSGPAGPAKPGASKGLILILPPRPTHLGADADICRLFPPNSFITALESSFLSDCFNSHKLLVPPLVTQALGGRGRWGGGVPGIQGIYRRPMVGF